MHQRPRIFDIDIIFSKQLDYIEFPKQNQSLDIGKGGIRPQVVDTEARKASRIQHYKNYEELLKQSKVKNNNEMAKLAGLYPSMFSDWAKGRCEPKADKLLAIARVLKVKPDKIIG